MIATHFSSISRSAVTSPLVNQARNMATLKEIQLRLKSVSNIGKITKSMKMIAATKMTKAQRAMDNARVFGSTTNAVFKHAETKVPIDAKVLSIAVSSDRGLCGGIHSSVSKVVKKQCRDNTETSVVVLGDKAKPQIAREAKNAIKLTFSQVAKNTPTFTEAAVIGNAILKSGIEFNAAQIVYNKFKSVIAFETTTIPVFSEKSIEESPKIHSYEIGDNVLKSLEEFAFGSTLFHALSEGHASEMAAKRTAMENATKNAGEMIDKLTLTYNRSRQAAITNDLIDIITGASAM